MVAWLARSRNGRRERRSRKPGGSAAARLRELVSGSFSAHESLQRAAIEYLALYGVPAIPVFTGPRVRPRPGGGFDLRGNRDQKGFSDIAAAFPPDGRLALIECKTGRASRSKEQIDLQQRFQAAGALCVVIRNALELEPYVRQAALRRKIKEVIG
jgi:hypothetical protein